MCTLDGQQSCVLQLYTVHPNRPWSLNTPSRTIRETLCVFVCVRVCLNDRRFSLLTIRKRELYFISTCVCVCVRDFVCCWVLLCQCVLGLRRNPRCPAARYFSLSYRLLLSYGEQLPHPLSYRSVVSQKQRTDWTEHGVNWQSVFSLCRLAGSALRFDRSVSTVPRGWWFVAWDVYVTHFTFCC